MRAALCSLVVASLAGACSVDAPHYVALDGGSGGADASTDAGTNPSPDATPQASFSVGHISSLRVGASATSYSISAIIRIVNTGEFPLDLGDAAVTNVFADHTGAVMTATWRDQTDLVLQPGFSAGLLDPVPQNLIVTSGLVTEPLQNSSFSYLTIVADLPNAGTWIGYNTDVTLRIGNARAVISLVTVGSGTGSSVTFDEAARAESAPL